ncbi:hypothetical protein [Wukongibacter sp. M2B1]|uniref:hypothetical protein n=1 Tax=Wukongibacter sp. M2B1 TaxID=3088895 RepID=UPI003D7BB1B5
MTNALKKSFSLCLSLILVFSMCIPSFAQGTEKLSKSNKKHVTRLDVKKKYNPLRNEKFQKANTSFTESDFNDENVHIARVTIYDGNKNKIKEYKGDDALDYLYESANQQVQTTESYINMRANGDPVDAGDFQYQITETYVDNDAETTVIRNTPQDVDDFSVTEFLFNAGMAFQHPVLSILTGAITQFLPSSLSYEAGDVVQTEYYRYWQNLVEMRKVEPYTGDWFPVVRAQKRIVDLDADFYLVSEEGDLATFDVGFGTVEENYHKDYYDDDRLITDALLTWNVWPYEHIYSWDGDDSVTDTHEVTPVIIKNEN